MAKFLGVRGSNPARLFGAGGLKVIDPRRIAAASDADAAVARLDPSSTARVTDVIWNWVFGESLAGQWQHLSRVYIPRTNELSAYTDLKNGTTATPSGTPVYTAQDGFTLQFGDTVDLSADLGSLYGAANVDACVVGTFVSAIADKLGYYSLVDGDPFSSEFQIAGRASTAKAAANWLGGFFGPTDTAYAESKLLNQVVQVQGASSSGAGYALLSFADGDSEVVAPAATPQTVLSASVNQNKHFNASNSCTQTWAMSYVASSELDFAGFAGRAGAMLAALATP
tara:strand:- start:242 stop:1090 length:849 start_codon:yes stop_codon:yes gene_type:complete